MAADTMHRGPSAIVAGLREFVAAFPGWQARIERLTSAGTVVIVEWDTAGTFQHSFHERAAHGKRFQRRGCAVADVEGGKIVRYRDYYDRLTLLGPLDLMDRAQERTPAAWRCARAA